MNEREMKKQIYRELAFIVTEMRENGIFDIHVFRSEEPTKPEELRLMKAVNAVAEELRWKGRRHPPWARRRY
jgi:hypothetical protein